MNTIPLYAEEGPSYIRYTSHREWDSRCTLGEVWMDSRRGDGHRKGKDIFRTCVCFIILSSMSITEGKNKAH